MTRRAWTQALGKQPPASPPRITARASRPRAPRRIQDRPAPPKPRAPRVTLEGLLAEIDAAEAIDASIPDEQRFPVRPVPKPRQTTRDRWAKRTPVLTYRAMADELRLRGARLPHRYQLILELPMPDGWPEEWKRTMEGRPHLRKPDGNNLLKAVEDALVPRDEALYSGRFDKRWGREPCIIIRKLKD